MTSRPPHHRTCGSASGSSPQLLLSTACAIVPTMKASPCKVYVYICCLIFFALASQGAEFDLGTHGTLSVTVPDGWSVNGKAANRPDGTSIGYAFAIKPRRDANAKCLLTFAYTTN